MIHGLEVRFQLGHLLEISVGHYMFNIVGLYPIILDSLVLRYTDTKPRSTYYEAADRYLT